MKHQALLSSKDKSKSRKYRLLQFLFGALRIKFIFKQTTKSQLHAGVYPIYANVVSYVGTIPTEMVESGVIVMMGLITTKKAGVAKVFINTCYLTFINLPIPN